MKFAQTFCCGLKITSCFCGPLPPLLCKSLNVLKN
ncbi:hypothetical protein HMPREF1306_04913 [Klebsiella pneumoniae subsp. pneumoniae WGLW2]|nr:hypothetical protein HMPREF1306_04913 [Klebsiella pneumoniae subsp. pneumoniae WGLW2]OUG79500.1 hypothetical protein AZZ97_004919 [Klebsiella pneumoniae]